MAYWLIGQALIGFCYIPWISVLCKAIQQIESVPTILKTPGLANVLACIKAFAGGQRWAAIIFLALVCLSSYGILRMVHSGSGKGKFRVFYLMMLVLLVSQIMRIYLRRYCQFLHQRLETIFFR